MKEFTFITFSYNHENYIEEHLESIKRIKNEYGKNIEVYLIIIDDASSDDTNCIINKWIKLNENIFKEITYIVNKTNEGIVKNICTAMKLCKTEKFKYLAGDDKYLKKNIFEFIDKCDDKKLIITPVVPFPDVTRNHDVILRFRSLVFADKMGIVQELMKYDNYFPAPGVFFGSKKLIDEDVLEEILDFKNIEDYPMWYNLLFIKRINIEVLIDPFINYQINSGISTNKNHRIENQYAEEVLKLRKKYRIRRYLFPKYINPYRYIYILFKFALKVFNSQINKKFEEHEELRMYIL